MSDHDPVRHRLRERWQRSIVALTISATLGSVLAGTVVAATSALETDPVPEDATALVQAFGRDRTSQDELTSLAVSSLQELTTSPAPSPQLAVGAPVLDGSRLVWTDHQRSMFVVPTSTGEVCYVVVPAGQSGCTKGELLAAGIVDWGLFDDDGLDVGAATTLHGLTPADVTEVSVVTSSGSTPADVQEGAFVVNIESVPVAIEYTTDAGRISRIPISSS